MKNRSITVQGTEVGITTRHEQDYISLTDMVRSFEGRSALIEQWLKNKDTVLFLGVWEQMMTMTASTDMTQLERRTGELSCGGSSRCWMC